MATALGISNDDEEGDRALAHGDAMRESGGLDEGFVEQLEPTLLHDDGKFTMECWRSK